MLDIHTTAVVHPGAELDSDVTIGAYAVIGEHVQIGAGTEVGPHAIVTGYTRMGRNNRIHPHAVVGGPPQDLKYRGEKTHLVIGDHNTIRECVTMNLATIEGETTRVGNHCLFMANAHVGHNARVGDHAILANGVALAGHVEIQDHAIIGGGTPVHQFCRIGSYAIIGGGFRVVQDVLPFMMAGGYPIRLTGPNVIGLERAGFDEGRRRNIKRAHRLLTRSNLNVSQAVVRMREEFGPEDEDIRMLLEFIESSERGIIL
jgi:UDP-N-acetylglucosamine acyltransferase